MTCDALTVSCGVHLISHERKWAALEAADITSAIAVLFEIMQHARMTLAKSPPGTTVGGW